MLRTCASIAILLLAAASASAQTPMTIEILPPAAGKCSVIVNLGVTTGTGVLSVVRIPALGVDVSNHDLIPGEGPSVGVRLANGPLRPGDTLRAEIRQAGR